MKTGGGTGPHPECLIPGLLVGLRIGISPTFPGNTGATGLGTTVGEPLLGVSHSLSPA